MSMGAVCFTSSSSNGGCWVVLVPPPLFFLEKRFFPPYVPYAKKQLRDLHKKIFPKKMQFMPKQSFATYAQKKKRVTLFPTIEVRFPPPLPVLRTHSHFPRRCGTPLFRWQDIPLAWVITFFCVSSRVVLWDQYYFFVKDRP